MTIDLGKSQGKRADFRPGEFDRTVREKGYRMLWSRAVLCPCRLNDDTEQPNPACTTCGGDGWQYVLPTLPADRPLLYEDDDPPFPDTTTGAATQAIVTQVTNDVQVFEQFGEWVMGASRLTTFSFNRLAYRDRLRMVDSTMVYQQVLPMPAGGLFEVGQNTREKLRYEAVTVHNVIAMDTGSPVDHVGNATVTEAGAIQVVGGAPPGTGELVSLVYECHPIWVVMEHTHTMRATLVAFKSTKKMGDYAELPQGVFAKLDFLVGPDTVAAGA